MKVLVLAAGYGTRLGALTENRPKPLLDINGKPLINFILDRFRGIGSLTEILVVTNAKFYGHFTDWAKEVDHFVPIRIIDDGTTTPEDRLGSIGDIEFVLEESRIEEDLLVVGGDNLFDFNISEYVAFAREQKNSVSMGIYDIHDLESAKLFGVVSIDSDRKLTGFEEKPEQPKSSLVAMCFYYLPKKTLGLVKQYLIESHKSDKAGDYIKWLFEKNDVYGFQFSGKWYDIGSLEAYKEAKSKFN